MIIDNEKVIEIAVILTMSDINVDDCIKITDFIGELFRENQELKAELELYENGIYYSSELNKKDKEIEELKKQQKEFIEYLEDEIYTIEPKGTLINFNCDYDSEEDYIRGVEKRVELDTLKNNLSKYKEIIGDKDE